MTKTDKKQKLKYAIVGLLALVVFLFVRGSSPRRNANWSRRIITSTRWKALEPYLYAQAQLESADFTSRLFRTYSNMWGMGCVRVRRTTQVGCTQELFDGGQTKGVYTRPSSSQEDIIDWLEQYNNPPFPEKVQSVEQFVREMKQRGYFTTSYENYLRQMKLWLTGGHTISAF